MGLKSKLKHYIIYFKTLFAILLLSSNFAYSFTAYSNQELDQLEKQFRQEINLSPQVLRDPLAKTYINQLARKLAAHGSMTKPEFFIVKSPEINAFAGPGGYIGVNTQLILASESESELAAVMAHEMAHVRLHHLYRMIEHQKNMQIPKLASMLAAIALGVVNPILGSGALMGTLSGFEQDSINYVRSNEKEADSIGIDILSRASFDPNGMPNFFRKMQQSTRYYYTDNIPAILRTHPLDEDRIAEAENRIAQHPAQNRIYSSPQYYLFKELVRHDTKHDSQQLLEFYIKDCQKTSPSYACAYGEALTYTETGKHQKAIQLLLPFVEHEFASDPYLNLALANAYQGTGQKDEAQKIYQRFYDVSPDNNAVVNQYSEFLVTGSDQKKTLSILLKAHRKFSQDVSICRKLARVQAQLHQTAEAYFTEANCHLIQGQTRAAMEQLNIAKKYAKNNKYMQERISAKIDEIKEALAPNQ